MFNMIRSDLRRLMRTRSLYVSMLFMGIVILMSAYSVWRASQYDISALIELAEQQTGQDLSHAEAPLALARSMGVDPGALLRSRTTPAALVSIPFTARLPVLFSAIFAALFMGRDIQTGYMKNLITIRGFRTKWFVSKALAAAIAIALMYASLFVFSFFGTLVLGNPFAPDMAALLPFLGAHYLACLAMAAAVFAALLLTQNKTGALVLGIVLSSGIHAVLLRLADLTGLIPLRLSGATLMERAMQLSVGGAVPGRFIAQALITMAAALALGFFSFRGRDLKL